MKQVQFGNVLGSVFLTAAVAWSQAVVFNDPVAWVTQRSDSIVAKVQLDTAQLKKKEIMFTATIVKNGAKRVVGSKTIKADDVSREVFVGMAGETLLGGGDYLKIEWAVVGTKDKGECAPVGISNLVKNPAPDTLHTKKLDKPIDASAVAGCPAVKAGGADIGVAWNETQMALVIKNAPADAVISVCFDGKTARNAFLAYSNHVVRYYAKNDSLATIHYERQFKDGKIDYTEKLWRTEAKKTTANGATVIVINWFDQQLLPLLDLKTTVNGRNCGFAVFSLDKTGAATAAWPAKAKPTIPGTWGIVNFALK